MTVDVLLDGRAIVRDPNGRTARLTSEQWAYIQAQRLDIRATHGKRIELFWYAQALAFHVLSQNQQKKAEKSLY